MARCGSARGCRSRPSAACSRNGWAGSRCPARRRRSQGSTCVPKAARTAAAACGSRLWWSVVCLWKWKEARVADLDPEDAKLITLARSARARTGAPEGAAGRTYVATTVDLPSLQLTALQGAVAAAVSSGVRTLEAAVVVTDLLEVDR